MTDWQELEKKYYMRTFERVPVTLVKGQGARVWDDNGREYLDFFAGLAVDSLGHCHPVMVKALTEQAKTLTQVTNLYYSIPQLQLAQILVENSCLDTVFFANSGTEANEGAVKLARRYGSLHRKDAYEVITTFNSFHGRTLAMTAATGQPKFQKPYLPMPAGFVNVESNSIDAIKKATTDNTCAVMLELVQAESGVYPSAEDYLKQVRQWCDEKDLLLILDEVQTGIGRIGALFGYQVYGIEPDIMTLAKGMGSGVPIGAFLAKQKASVFVPGDHGSTFGGNPLVCAVGYTVVKYIIDNDIAGNARRVGQYLMTRLQELKQKYPLITDVRGRGLLVAIEFTKEVGARMLAACLERGLLVNKVKPNAIRLVPPLIIGKAEVDEAINILDSALTAVSCET
ncbi:MAG: aspartate aminotransferase family protein [Dehalococcoidales bacterium]|nr:aspartate aminotransferase family protein [Dehalococcoidales bacterium]